MRRLPALLQIARRPAGVVLRACARGRRNGAHDLWPLIRILCRSDREKAPEPFPARYAGPLVRHRGVQPYLHKFCQNWDISKAREIDRLNDRADPTAIAAAAVRLGCRSVAFTYNDPVIFLEYAIDTAKACHAAGLATVAVTAGYVAPEARREFFAHMDAANVDLKAFTEDFYRTVCGAHLEGVLDTLVYLKRDTSVWFEITTLLIPARTILMARSTR